MGAWGRGRGQQPSERRPPPPALSPPLLAVSSHCTLTHAHAHIRTRTHTQAHSIAHAHERALFPRRKRHTDLALSPTPKDPLGNVLSLSFLYLSLSALCISPHHSAPLRITRGKTRTHAHGKAQVRGIKCDSGRASECIPGKARGYTRATDNFNLNLRLQRSCVGAATHTHTHTPHTSPEQVCVGGACADAAPRRGNTMYTVRGCRADLSSAAVCPVGGVDAGDLQALLAPSPPRPCPRPPPPPEPPRGPRVKSRTPETPTAKRHSDRAPRPMQSPPQAPGTCNSFRWSEMKAGSQEHFASRPHSASRSCPLQS